jgi:chromosome segregation ATPase
MAGKLEKAQAQYEKLLIELGSQAEIVAMLQKADPAWLDAFQQAKELLADRRLELEFIQGEIESNRQNRGQRIEELKREIAGSKDSVKQYERTIGVKQDKAEPLKTKLKGGEYDLKFVEKALWDERQKKKKAAEKENYDKVKRCEDKIKSMKIDILRRKGQLEQLRVEIGKFENPADRAKDSIEETEARIEEQEAELADLERESGSELLEDLKRQEDEKQREVKRSKMHVEDTLADLGENLYEKRAAHPVLEKYYTDIDLVAEAIDKLQGAT